MIAFNKINIAFLRLRSLLPRLVMTWKSDVNEARSVISDCDNFYALHGHFVLLRCTFWGHKISRKYFPHTICNNKTEIKASAITWKFFLLSSVSAL